MNNKFLPKLARLAAPLVAIVFFLSSVTLLATTAIGTAQASDETVVRQLGGTTRFCGPLRNEDDLRLMASRDREDLEAVLSMAGLDSIADQVIGAMAQGDVSDATVEPGERLEWMALRRAGKPDLIRNARWGGDAPFDAFAIDVETTTTRYEFMLPKVCGNLSLMRTVTRPAAVVVPPETVAEEPPEPREEPVVQTAPVRAAEWYVAADAGYVDISDGDYDFFGAAVIPHKAEYDGGVGYFVQAGRRFGNWRAELELAYRSNDADEFGSIVNVVSAKGSIDATSLMINGIYDFRIGERLRPFLGAGVGGTKVDMDDIRKSVTDPDRTGTLFGDDNKFSWQLLAGASWQLAERWAIAVKYRYLDAGDADVNYGVGCNASGSNCIFSDKVDQDYDAHSISAGLHFDF